MISPTLGFMDLLSIVRLFGKSSRDKEVISLLRELGITSEPELNDGDTDVNVEAKAHGLYLVFTDEAFFTKESDKEIGEGPLLLTNVSVYFDPPEDYNAFKGTLPFGLSAKDHQEQIRQKLGTADFQDPDLSLDRWTINGNWVYIKYSDDLKSIADMSLQLPDKE